MVTQSLAAGLFLAGMFAGSLVGYAGGRIDGYLHGFKRGFAINREFFIK